MADDPQGPDLERVREALRRRDREAEPPEDERREDDGGEREAPPS
jgi:hypothetical protein